MAGLFGAIERLFISVCNPTADPKCVSMLKQLQSMLAVLLVYHHLLWGPWRPKEALLLPKLVLQIASSLLSQSDYAKISHAFGRRLVFNIFDQLIKSKSSNWKFIGYQYMAPCVQMELRVYCSKGVAWHEAQMKHKGELNRGFGTGSGCFNWLWS